MSLTPLQAYASVFTALATVTDLRVLDSEDAAQATPPCAVVAPPVDIQWETLCGTPTECTISVLLAVSFNGRAADTLLGFVELIQGAIEANTQGTVAAATLQVSTLGDQDLPSYVLSVIFPLGA